MPPLNLKNLKRPVKLRTRPKDIRDDKVSSKSTKNSFEVSIELNNHKFIAKIIACKKNHRRSQTTSNQIILNQLDFQAVPVLVGQDHGGLEDHVVGHGDLGENEVGHGRVGHGSP